MKLSKTSILVAFLLSLLILIFEGEDKSNIEGQVTEAEEVRASIRIQKPNKELLDNVEESSAKNFVTNELHWKDIANNQISPLVNEASNLRYNSLFPLKPEEVYLDNIAKAEAGEPQAQFWVARALRECKGVATSEELQKLVNENFQEQHVLNSIASHSKYCRALLGIVGKDTLDNWDTHYEWLTKAKDGNNVNATLWHFELHPDQYTRKDAFDLLSKAFTNKEKTDVFIYNKVLTYLASYSVENNEVLFSSWELAICRAYSGCDDSLMKAYVNYQYEYLDYEDILEKADQIFFAMQSGEGKLITPHMNLSE